MQLLSHFWIDLRQILNSCNHLASFNSSPQRLRVCFSFRYVAASCIKYIWDVRWTSTYRQRLVSYVLRLTKCETDSKNTNWAKMHLLILIRISREIADCSHSMLWIKLRNCNRCKDRSPHRVKMHLLIPVRISRELADYRTPILWTSEDTIYLFKKFFGVILTLLMFVGIGGILKLRRKVRGIGFTQISTKYKHKLM